MELLDVFGRKRKIALAKYRIDWDGPSRSNVQKDTKNFLRAFWEFDECFEELPVLGTRLSCDIINFTKNIAIEVDGAFHAKFSPFHHKCRAGFLNSHLRDGKKDEWLEKNGLTIVRIKEKDVPKLSLDFLLKEYGIDILIKQ